MPTEASPFVAKKHNLEFGGLGFRVSGLEFGL